MSTHGPDFDSLIDEHVRGRERERLARAHDALMRVDPLPELPDSLSRPPEIAVRRLPIVRYARSRRRPLLAAAAAIVAVAVGAATYSLSAGSGEGPDRAVTMHATAAAPAAHASLRIGRPDAAGNWPITLRVQGLPPLSAGSYYEMYLTSKGRIVAGCGTFRTGRGTTVVQLNVPYRLGEYSGWLIRREHPHETPGPTLLTT